MNCFGTNVQLHGDRGTVKGDSGLSPLSREINQDELPLRACRMVGGEHCNPFLAKGAANYMTILC